MCKLWNGFMLLTVQPNNVYYWGWLYINLYVK